VVHLEKRLEWRENSAIRRLTDDSHATEHGPWSEPGPARDAPA
jgi:hypothetical protein